jgi:hypothetical protein
MEKLSTGQGVKYGLDLELSTENASQAFETTERF